MMMRMMCTIQHRTIMFVLQLLLVTTTSTVSVMAVSSQQSSKMIQLPQDHHTNNNNYYHQHYRSFPMSVVVTRKPLSRLTSALILLRGGGSSRQPHQQQQSSRTIVSSSSSSLRPGQPSSSVVSVSPPPDGTVDPTSHIINLIKTIIGAGVFGIPAGIIASFATTATSNKKVILVKSLSLLILIGLLAANGFNNIGQICRCTNSISYAQAWSTTVSQTTTIVPNIACIMVTLCTLITYSMVLSDTIPSLLRPLIQQQHLPFDLIQRGLSYITRTNTLIVLTTIVLLPLCLLQSLSALAPFSFVGICGMIYTAIMMTIRYLDQSYGTTTGISTTGRFLTSMEPKCRPNFDWSTIPTTTTTSNGNAAILISMLSTAYMAHYNAPKFYWELKNRTAETYTKVVYQSFIGAILIMIVISSMGFLTFGINSQSLILNNYSTLDPFMSLSRWAVVLSLVFSYPLAFVGVRDGIYNLFNLQSQQQSPDQIRRTNQIVTVTLLSIITFIAAIMKDIRVILSLGGATFGNLLAYVFPAFMVVGLAHKKRMSSSSHAIMTNDDDSFPTIHQERFAILTAVLGVMMGVVGTIKAIQAI